MTQESVGSRKQVAIAVFVLVVLVLAVFHPVRTFEFSDLDTVSQIIENPRVHKISPENLKHIFTTWSWSSYYPVRSLSFALDVEIWGGLNPGGFKTSNVFFHLVNTLLVFWLILRLFGEPRAEPSPGRLGRDVGVAGVAAGIFAIHPVVVETVVWVPAREELLMVLGTLGCFHCHLAVRCRQLAADGKGVAVWTWFALETLCCIIACLSNAVAAVIPFIITAWDAVMIPWPKFRRLAWSTSVLWAIGLATVVVKRISENLQPKELDFAALSWGHIIAIVKIYGLNLKTLVWPTRLSIDYTNVDHGTFQDIEFYIGAGCIALTGLCLWVLRYRKFVLFGLLWSCLALGPVSQIIPHHYHRADRFLYLPLVGIVVAVAMVLRPVVARLNRRVALVAGVMVGLAWILVLDTLASRQVYIWRDNVSLWQNALRVSPESPWVHRCLANAFALNGQFEQAIPHYEIAIRLWPDDLGSPNNYAHKLSMCHNRSLRNYARAVQLARNGYEIAQRKGEGLEKLRRTLAIAHMNWATDLKQKSEFRQAIEHNVQAMSADPTYEVPRFNLAEIFARCPDPEYRQPDEAIRLAEEALGMVPQPGSVQFALLARVYAGTGLRDKAIHTMGRAIEEAEIFGDPEWTALLRNELQDLESTKAKGPANGSLRASDESCSLPP